MKPGEKQLISLMITYLILCLIAVVTIFPFLWMVVTSFKEPSQALVLPPNLIPDPWYWGNYPYIFKILPFATFFMNSVKITLLVLVGRLFVCSLGGYSFARLPFPGKNLAFGILIGALLIPVAVRIIPLYVVYKYIGWLDTHYPLIIPQITANTFGTFLFRQYFMTVPDELEDAALIDGCSFFRIYWNIMLPQAKPMIATLAIFTYMNVWNMFLEPLVYLNKIEKFTLPIGLAFFQGEYTTEYTALMAGSVVTVVPILIIYLLAQKYFIRSVVISGLK